MLEILLTQCISNMVTKLHFVVDPIVLKREKGKCRLVFCKQKTKMFLTVRFFRTNTFKHLSLLMSLLSYHLFILILLPPCFLGQVCWDTVYQGWTAWWWQDFQLFVRKGNYNGFIFFVTHCLLFVLISSFSSTTSDVWYHVPSYIACIN